MRNKILDLLKRMHPSDAIVIIESIGKELRKKNSIRISKNIPVEFLDMDRPDLEILK
tara:strand:+ start:1162 stop:1332 length:171 start_codon:yes stop_codon:yes gene_type:complete